ncbi:MAG: hypothetical protein AAB225_01380, partial [Acidobacteriota bacterium]
NQHGGMIRPNSDLRTVKYISIPRNWIVDATGKWRLEQIGFGSGEDWEKDMLEKIEQTRPEASAGPQR